METSIKEYVEIAVVFVAIVLLVIMEFSIEEIIGHSLTIYS